MQNILLATDGSPHAENAAWFLARFPHEEKLELAVLSVIEAPHISRSYSMADRVLAAVDREKAFAAEACKKIEEMFGGANVHLQRILREGRRGDTIVDVATELKTDLIVMGARGRSPVSRLLLGSTSDFVATHADCSVLVVRPTGIRQAKRPLRVALGYEESKPAQAALEEIREWGWGGETEIHVLTAVRFIPGVAHSDELEFRSVKTAAMAAAERAAHQLRDVAPHIRAQLIENPHAGEGLVAFAEDHHCDLLVIGETRRNPLERVLMGSVSRFVLRHAPCSVWIARNRTPHSVSTAPVAHRSDKL